MKNVGSHSPLFIRPPPIAEAKSTPKTGVNEALRSAYMLDTSAGQVTMAAATSKAFGIPLTSITRPVVDGYSPYDEDLTGYEQYLDEFESSTSPAETLYIKQMIDNNLDLRRNVEDYGALRFGAGLLDPINLIPVPFSVGRGFVDGAKAAMAKGAPIVAGTEMLRHEIDPTSTWQETAFASLGGTLFMGLMGGAVGRIPHTATSVSDVLRQMTPPPGTTSMFAGVPWHMGTSKGVFKRLGASLRSAASTGEPRSRTVDPERIRVAEDKNLVEIHVDDELTATAVRDGDTLKMVEVTVPEHLRDTGVGTASYKTAIQYADDNGLKFVSDNKVSEINARRYAGLKDENYNVKQNSKEVDPESGDLVADGPVFEVLPQVDPKRTQIPQEVRDHLDDIEMGGKALARQLDDADEAIKIMQKKAKDAPKAGGARTKAKAKLKDLLEERNRIDWALRRNRAEFQDLNVKAAQMLDEATIKDWDLLPTGYNKLLGKLDQFPWWTLMKTPLRDVAPDLAVKYQMFALRMGATPGLNNIGNRVGATTGPSIESLATEYTGPWLAATRQAQTIYRKYAGYGETSSQVKQFAVDSAQRVRSSVNKAMGGEPIKTTSDGKMTYQEFERQITIAIANGGDHAESVVAEAASLFVPVLKKIGDEGKKLGVFATQRNIARRIDRIDSLIEKHNQRWGTSQPDGIRNMVDELELEKIELEEMAQSYRDADNPNFIHRMWIAEEVKAKEVELKAMLTEEFNRNPLKQFKDKDGNVIAEDPDVVAGRVNEAYASILRDATTGSNLEFAPRNADKRDWLVARQKTLEENLDGLPPKTVETQLKIIERKLKRIRGGESTVGASGPLIGRRLELDNQKLIELDLIEGNVTTWMQHYVARTAPVIETARMFGDGRAQAHIDEIISEVYERAARETDPKKQATLLKEAERGAVAMNDLRDIVHGVYQIPDDPSAISGRFLRALRNFNILGAMGRSVFMAFGDVGNVVISQGFIRSLGHSLEHFASGIRDGNIKMMRDEVDLAGSVSEVILGQRYHQLTDAGGVYGMATKAERGLAGAAQRFFLLNLLGPWTDMARRFSGGMLQSRLIENARLWKQGTLSAEEIKVMGRLGINRQQAIQFADEWAASGSLKHKSMFIANTEQWVSEPAKRTFRAAMNTEINRMVPTPGAVDKPKALLKSEWWKVIGQYRGFSIAATHRIMGAGLQTKGAQKYSGLASMVGIAMIVDAWKRPDYIQMPLEEQVLRAVELSAVTGIILDLNDTLERASAGSIGLRPMLGMDIRERSPNWANRMGTMGAVPNQWLTLMYGLSSDDAETNDLARAIRYMIPYNNLLWWNEAFNRAQRSTVDFIEDES